MSLSPGLLPLCLNHRSITSIYFKDVFALLLLLLIPQFQQVPPLTEGGKCSIFNFSPLWPVHCNAKDFLGEKKSCLRIDVTKSLGHSQGQTFISVMCISRDISSHISNEKPSVREWSIRSINTENSRKTLNWHFYIDFLRFVVCFVRM